MPAKTGSRNGLSYGWALGENNWNTGMDGNLTFIDRFGVHLSFKSFLNTPPGSPAAGDCHVIDAVPTGVWVGKAGQVAVYDDGAWRYGVPRTGWRAYCEADERPYVYDGGWAPTASEWTAATVDQAEAEAGTATTRRAWTSQRVRQAIAAWWASAPVTTVFGRAWVLLADAAAGRATLGLGTMATQNAAGVSITGGTAVLTGSSSVTAGAAPLTVTATGTGASLGTLTVSANSTGAFGVTLRASGASGSTAAIPTLAMQNESGAYVSAVRSTIGTDGGANVYLQVTPAGDRATDRRITGLTITGAGNLISAASYSTTTATAANAVWDTDGTAKRSTSTLSLKSNVEPYEYPRAKALIEQAEAIWYRSECDGDDKSLSHYGLAAEQVAAIDPRFAFWGYVDSDYEEGEDEDGATTKRLKPGAVKRPVGVAYDRIVVALMQVVQREVLGVNHDTLSPQLQGLIAAHCPGSCE